MKLICEINEEVQYLEEEKDGKKNYFIEGIFMQGDIKNRNGRMYPGEILEKEVNRYNESYIKKNRAYGELGHPNGPTINLERASHLITSLKKEGSNFIGRAKIMTETPMGSTVKAIMNDGGSLGVSSRGMGTLKPNKSGIQEVQNDFYLATAADIVADPSAPDAFVRGIMENKEWIWENEALREVDVSQCRDIITNASSRDLEEAKLLVFTKLMAEISKK